MKKIHRFLLSTAPARPITHITDERIVHQITRVLRMERGETCILFWDNGPDIEVTIEAIGKHDITVTESASFSPTHDPLPHLTVAIGIPKSDTFEYIAQKLSELGVARIIPLVTERTIKTSLKTDRLRAISDEALELSGGSKRMVIDEPAALADVLTATAALPSYVLDIPSGARSASLPHIEDAIIYIGPEGGWSDRERAQFATRGVKVLHLADRTFRTETASIAAAYALLWGNDLAQ